MKWLKKQIKKILIGLGITSALVLGGSSNVPMKELYSMTTIAVDTADGDIDFDEYLEINKTTSPPVENMRLQGSKAETIYLIRTKPKDEAWWETVEDPALIAGKKEVHLVCDGCAAYTIYQKQDGTQHREKITLQDYDKFRTVKDYVHQIKTEFVLLGAIHAHATPTYDNSASQSPGSAGTSITLSYAFANSAASNPVLVVGVTKNVVDDPSGVTYNAVSMGAKQTSSYGDVNDDRGVWIYALAGVNTASAHNIVANFGASTWAGFIVASYSGVNQVTPVGNTDTATDGAVPPSNAVCTTAAGLHNSVLSTALNSLLVQIWQGRNTATTITPNNSQTSRADFNCSNCGNRNAIMDLPAPTIQTYTLGALPNNNDRCGTVAIELIAGAAPSSADSSEGIMLIGPF